MPVKGRYELLDGLVGAAKGGATFRNGGKIMEGYEKQVKGSSRVFNNIVLGKVMGHRPCRVFRSTFSNQRIVKLLKTTGDGRSISQITAKLLVPRSTLMPDPSF